jgi:hypothetical protein
MAALGAIGVATAYALGQRRKRKEEEARQAAEAAAEAARRNASEVARRLQNWLQGQAMLQNALNNPILSDAEKQGIQPKPKNRSLPDPETADMTEKERLKAYQQTTEYQARHKQTLLYNLEHRYQVTLSGTIPWSYDSVIVISNAVGRMSQKLGGPDVFAKAVGPVQIQINNQISSGGLTYGSGKIEFQQSTLTHQQPPWLGEVAVVHELAHAWAFNQSPVSRILGVDLLSYKMRLFCGQEEGPTIYGKKNWISPAEEWAESVAAYVYPEYIDHLQNHPTHPEVNSGLGPRHREFIEQHIKKLQDKKK